MRSAAAGGCAPSAPRRHAVRRECRRQAPARCSSIPEPRSRDASMIRPVQAETVPATIRVLPKPNSLIGIPYPIATQAGQKQANPGDQQHKHHRTHPARAGNARLATQRHDTVIMYPSPTGNCGSGSLEHARPLPDTGRSGSSISFRHVARAPTKVLKPAGDCCIASGNYATIPNYLERELRYMDAGELRLKALKAGPSGDAGLPIAMSSITTSAIDTPARRSVERTCDDLAIAGAGCGRH